MASHTSSGVFRFGDFELDLPARQLRHHGISTQLQEQPLRILTLLLENPGVLITRQELCQNIWPAGTFVDSEHGLNTAVKKLRKVLQDDATNPKLIETIPRNGYRFIGTVTKLNGNGAPVYLEPSPHVVATLPDSGSSFSKHWVRLIVAIAVLLSSAGFLAWKVIGSRSHAAAGHVIHSVAVLPLENLTGNPNQEYLVDGLTDSLITNVAQIHSLAVISRTSVMAYKGTHKAIREIARELNVDALVEGTVSEANGVIRVNAQFIRGDTDTHLWAGQFQGELKDLLRLQNEVTEAIAREIHAALPSSLQTAVMNPQAYEPYLRGRYFWNKRRPEDINTAIGYFKQAIEKDPNFAQAYAGLADCYTLQVLNGWVSRDEGFLQASAASKRALELNDSLPEAHTSLGGVRALYEWNWSEAEREFRRAIALSPSYAPAHHWYSVLYLAPVGRLDEALAEIQRAHELDPLSAIIETDLGFVHYLRREYSEALADYKKTLELDSTFVPAHFRLARLYEKLGRFEECVKEEIAIARISSPDWRPDTADRIEKAYKADGFKGYLQFLNELHSVTPVVMSGAAGILDIEEGNIDAAFRDFSKAAEHHDPQLLYLSVDPAFDSLRSDPRYKLLLSRVGVAPPNRISSGAF